MISTADRLWQDERQWMEDPDRGSKVEIEECGWVSLE